jgi:predicted metal-dependent hydrolase
MSWQSKEEFNEEVHKIASKMKLEIGTIYMRDMTRKWASITSDGKRLNFNNELLDLHKDIGRYVIIHELTHLTVPNHGKLFKALLRTYLEDVNKIEKRLKALSTIN